MHFLLVYAEINFVSILSMLGRVVLLHLSGLKASRSLFTELLNVVLYAPMSFFDSKSFNALENFLTSVFSQNIFQ